MKWLKLKKGVYEVSKSVCFGVVNCNRLYYLKSCITSLEMGIEKYDGRVQKVVVDNASVEEGTEEYLCELESRGWHVKRNEQRDYHNEFAKGLNYIVEQSDCVFTVPLQGDMQFIRTDWIDQMQKFFYKNRQIIGCVRLDAQRKVTLESRLINHGDDDEFYYDMSADPISGAADVCYDTELLRAIYPWNVDNESHEGGGDSETRMLMKVREMMNDGRLRRCVSASFKIPASVAIYTDERGTNARIRKNIRYGNYLPPDQRNLYYEMIDEKFNSLRLQPYSIEEVTQSTIGLRMIDVNGNWKKNPIRPEMALPSDIHIISP